MPDDPNIWKKEIILMKEAPYRVHNNTLFILIALTSSYTLFLLISSVFINKLVLAFNHITTMSAFFFPLTVIISDIVLEVYGYRVARTMVWLGLLTQFLFAILSKLALVIPQPPGYGINIHYNYVLNNLIPIYFGALAAAVVADFINIYLLSKLKILTKGKYFVLRAIACGTIGNFFYTAICCLVIYYPHQPLKYVVEIGTMIYLIKLAYVCVFAIPAALLATTIKKKGEIDVYDYNVNFNPFKVFDNE
jgi:uncharacterized integral membrane protein (TIGR00697 family)